MHRYQTREIKHTLQINASYNAHQSAHVSLEQNTHAFRKTCHRAIRCAVRRHSLTQVGNLAAKIGFIMPDFNQQISKPSQLGQYGLLCQAFLMHMGFPEPDDQMIFTSNGFTVWLVNGIHSK